MNQSLGLGGAPDRQASLEGGGDQRDGAGQAGAGWRCLQEETGQLSCPRNCPPPLFRLRLEASLRERPSWGQAGGCTGHRGNPGSELEPVITTELAEVRLALTLCLRPHDNRVREIVNAVLQMRTARQLEAGPVT